MRHDNAKLPILWGRTASDMSLSDLKNRGSLYEILESIITDNRHVYPVTTRQKQQLIQFTDKHKSILWIKGIFGSAGLTREADDRLADAIVDEEIACNPWDDGVDAK